MMALSLSFMSSPKTMTTGKATQEAEIAKAKMHDGTCRRRRPDQIVSMLGGILRAQHSRCQGPLLSAETEG